MFSTLRQSSRAASGALRYRATSSVGVDVGAGVASGRVNASVVRMNMRSAMRGLTTKRYTKDHELVVFDDATNLGTVSITNYAQSSLGDVVYVELPSVGAEIGQGDQIGVVESVKAASELYAPISGTVQEVNNVLDEQPGLINKSPEDEAWLCKVKLSKPEELENLFTQEAYEAYCAEESE